MKTNRIKTATQTTGLLSRLKASLALPLALCAIASASMTGWAQVSITSLGTAFTQNFDGMGSSGTASLPTGFKIGTDWASGTTATTLAYGTTGAGAVTSSSSGGTINWANGVTASATDRSLGFLNTGTFTSPRSIVYAFVNNSGSTITSLTIAFDYEKSRSGSRQFDWTFFHGSTSSPTTAAASGDQSYPADADNTVVSNPPLTTSKTVTITGLSIAPGATYYLKWTFTGLGGSTNGKGIGIDNFSLTASGAPTVTIDNTGAPAAGNITAGTSDASLFGFRLTPSASVDFTALSLTTAGTANSSDLSNFRVVFDADNSGTYNGGDSVVSGSGLSLANPISFTISGQTGVSTARRYLIIADVASGATAGRTFTGSIAAAGDVSTTGTESGTAAGNQKTVVAAATPTISVTGGPLSFGNVAVNSTSTEQSVSVSGVNLTANILVTPPSGFEISTTSGSGFSSSPITLTQSGGTVSSTPIYVVFKPTLIQAYSGNLAATSTGATEADGALSGTGVYSSGSDIIADGAFSYPANVAYGSFQETDLTAASLGVARFVLRDGGAGTDSDSASTTLSAISFTVANSANLRRVALYDDANNELGEVAAGATVTFSSLSLAATDGGTKTLTVRASFQSAVTDNQQFSFTVSSATASASGSGFAAANAGGAASSTSGDNNRIEVTATKLAFTSVPSSVSVGQNFAATVQAQDANNNVDLDDTTSVTLSKASGSGTLGSTTGLTQNLASGAKTWADVQISAAGTFTIQAAGGSLSTATSGSISATILLVQEDFDYTANDNITAHGWIAHSGGGTSPIKVQSPGLSFGSYASSGIGLSASVAANGEDDNKPFASQTSGSVYAAFMVNASAATTGGEYFFHFNQGDTIFYGRVFLKRDASSNLAFGLSKNSEAANYSGFTYSLNTTYLVVLKYTFNGSAQDDAVALYINPTSGGLEPSPTIGPITFANTDATGLIAVSLRQGSSFPNVLVDGIRVGTTWADVVNHIPTATSDVASTTQGQTITLAGFKLLANDSDPDGDTLTITAASATGGSASVVNGNVQYTAPGSGSSDTITYTINDGHGGSASGTITVTLSSSGASFNQISAVTIIGGDLQLSYLGIPGTNYALEITHNLTPPVTWSPLQTNPAAVNGSIIFTNTPSLAPTNDFYRTRYIP